MAFFFWSPQSKNSPPISLPFQKKKKKKKKKKKNTSPRPQQELGYVAEDFPLVPHFEEISPVLAEPQYIPCQV
jgi:hypothetical protein